MLVALSVQLAGAQQVDGLARRVQEKVVPATGTNVTIWAQDGIITLVGSVGSLSARERAVALAKEVPDVRSVVDLLEVAPPVARNDSLIAEDVTRAISLVPGAEVSGVLVYDGKAIVRGRVDSVEHQRELEAAAKKIEGVIALNDQTIPSRRAPAEAAKPMPGKTDAEITRTIRDAYLNDPRLLYWEPVVSVTNGVVKLTGIVSDLRSKLAAADTAANTAGVRAVCDFLRVAGQPATRSDRELQERVQLALSQQLGRAAQELIATVVGGTAYLTGTAASPAQRERAEQVAGAVPGVAFIENELSIVRSQ